MAFGCAPRVAIGHRVGREFGLGLVALALAFLTFVAHGEELLGERRNDGAAAAPIVHLVALGSLEGQFEPCGCEPEPRGGLARRAGALAQLRARGEPVLHLDLGNSSEVRGESRDLTNRFIWDTLAHLHLDAAMVGERELENWPAFAAWAEASGVPLVSTNLFVAEKGQSRRAGVPSLIVERGGLRFGLLGVLAPLPTATPLANELSFYVQDPTEALRATLPSIQTQVDLVVLISQLSPAQTEELSERVGGIDIALCGMASNDERNSGQSRDRIPSSEKTILQMAGKRGEYFGHLVLHVDDDGRILSFENKSPALDSRFPEDVGIAHRVGQIRTTVDSLGAVEKRQEQDEFNALFERWRSASK